MTERHLRCGADGCHFCCCCTNKHDRLGCLRRHVLWHLHNWLTIPRPPRETILLLDELEAWEDNEIEKNNKIKNEFEKKNENKNENEDDETSSSCDGDKEKQNNDFNENLNKYKANQIKIVDGEKGDSAADGKKDGSAAEGEKKDSAADGEKEDAAAAEGEKEDSATVNKETKAETEPRTAQGSNQEKLLNVAPKKNRSQKQQRKIVQENDNLRKRKYVHEYVNLSSKKFKFMELPDTEPPPVPTLHQLPSQLPDFTNESKMPLHVGLPPSQVPYTSGAGTLGPYRRSYNKKKSKKKFRKFQVEIQSEVQEEIQPLQMFLQLPLQLQGLHWARGLHQDHHRLRQDLRQRPALWARCPCRSPSTAPSAARGS